MEESAELKRQQEVIERTKTFGKMLRAKLLRTPDRRLGGLGEIDISHYESGSGRFIIPKSIADKIPHKTSFDLWDVNSPDEIAALLQADEFNKKKRDAPILIFIPVQSEGPD